MLLESVVDETGQRSFWKQVEGSVQEDNAHLGLHEEECREGIGADNHTVDNALSSTMAGNK